MRIFIVPKDDSIKPYEIEVYGVDVVEPGTEFSKLRILESGDRIKVMSSENLKLSVNSFDL